jgi:heme-degrading monooxygenase HmoA
MFTRVSTILGKPERIDEGIRNYKEQMLPAAKKMSGFKQALFMVDRKTGKMVSITFWDSEKNLLASTGAADKLRAQGVEHSGTNQPSIVEIYEVAVQS